MSSLQMVRGQGACLISWSQATAYQWFFGNMTISLMSITYRIKTGSVLRQYTLLVKYIGALEEGGNDKALY